MVREVKGIEKMSILGAGRGARERGGRRLEVEVNSKHSSYPLNSRGPRETLSFFFEKPTVKNSLGHAVI